ncbi:rab11 family-interacting protein 4-like [Notamacropus eugenii]|uniref:rab11 family-interacting protein 4-like n=1 Tax=Notamacropus eugenii TaxID=9315 RepID=UPI003B67A613
MAGGAGWAGGPAALLRSVRRLREVFEVCGRDADGFLRVERFVALGLQFGQGEEVEKLVKYLDPNDMGRINFKDFCHGVFAMKGCEEVLKDVLAMESTAALQYEPEIGDYEDQVRAGRGFIQSYRTSPFLGEHFWTAGACGSFSFLVFFQLS